MTPTLQQPMRVMAITALAALSLGMYACGSTAAQSEEENGVVDDAPAVVRAESSPDQRLIDAIATNDKFGIEEAQVILSRSQSPEARKFAQNMVDAHTSSTANLVKEAAAVNMQIGPLVPAPSRNKQRLDSLRTLNMVQLDARYAADQIDSYQRTLAELTQYAKDGASPSLRTLAQQQAATLSKHIETARNIADPKMIHDELTKQQSAP